MYQSHLLSIQLTRLDLTAKLCGWISLRQCPDAHWAATMEIVNLSHDVDAILHKRTQSGSRYDGRTAELQLNLLHAMRRDPEGHRLYASFLFERELWLLYKAECGTSCMITVTIDQPDYGALEDGLPRFHYRMAYRITGCSDGRVGPLNEARPHSSGSAVEFVHTAISETQKTQ